MFGILNLHKPAGCTSRDVVNRVARLVGRKVKVGHAGTLDPLATGVLLVCVGPATRLVPFIHEYSKSYRGTFQLGASSSTDDSDGELTPVPIPDDLTPERLQAILPKFVGEIQQVPPAFSAIKVDGQRAYAAARRGEQVELAPRQAVIHRLELVDYSPPQFTLNVECGTGTYVRAIGRDLAAALGTAAYMTQLERTRIGPFEISTAIDPEQLTRENFRDHLHSPPMALREFEQVVVSDEAAELLRNGRRLPFPMSADSAFSRAYPEGRRVAVTDSTGRLVCTAQILGTQLQPTLVFPAADDS